MLGKEATQSLIEWDWITNNGLIYTHNYKNKGRILHTATINTHTKLI